MRLITGCRLKSNAEERLEDLAAEMDRRVPFQARVERTASRGMVRVVNPAANWLTERVSCRDNPDAGGELWFFWSWGDSIGPANDVPGVAAAIQRVLTPEHGRA